MKSNLNFITASLLCGLFAVSLQATHTQSQEFFDRLAIAQAPESKHVNLSESMFDNASQINQHVTTAQAFQAVADSADDLYQNNKKKYDNKANAALREFYHTANNAAEKMNSSLQTIHRHHNEQTRALQTLNDNAKKLTQDVHDAFIKTHRALSESEMNIRVVKKNKEEEKKQPVKKSKKSKKKNPTKKASNKKSKKMNGAQNFENEIA